MMSTNNRILFWILVAALPVNVFFSVPIFIRDGIPSEGAFCVSMTIFCHIIMILRARSDYLRFKKQEEQHTKERDERYAQMHENWLSDEEDEFLQEEYEPVDMRCFACGEDDLQLNLNTLEIKCHNCDIELDANDARELATKLIEIADMIDFRKKTTKETGVQPAMNMHGYGR